MRVYDWAITTQTELTGILIATEFLFNQGSRFIFCDSQSALKALNTLDKVADDMANDIRINVYRAKEQGHVKRFVWILSHTGIPKHDHADRLVKSARDKQSVDIEPMA